MAIRFLCDAQHRAAYDGRGYGLPWQCERKHRPLASPFGRGAQCAHWAERVCGFFTLSVAAYAAPAPPEGEPSRSLWFFHNNDIVNFEIFLSHDKYQPFLILTGRTI